MDAELRTSVLRLSAPMMSFGAPAQYRLRPTEQTPTLSSVLGIIGASAGLGRQENVLEAFPDLIIATRSDASGHVTSDYHTVSLYPTGINSDGIQRTTKGYSWIPKKDQDQLWRFKTAEEKKPVGETLLSTRYYLNDATFIVALETRSKELQRYLKKPIYAPYFGRKACAPAFPYYLGTFSMDWRTVLNKIPTISQNESITLPITILRTDSIPRDLPSAPYQDKPLGYSHRSWKIYQTNPHYFDEATPPSVPSLPAFLDFIRSLDALS